MAAAELRADAGGGGCLGLFRRAGDRAGGRAARPGESGRSRAAFSMVINVMSAMAPATTLAMLIFFGAS